MYANKLLVWQPVGSIVQMQWKKPGAIITMIKQEKPENNKVIVYEPDN